MIFAEISFRVTYYQYGAPQVRTLRNFRVNLYSRTPLRPSRTLTKVKRAPSGETEELSPRFPWMNCSYYMNRSHQSASQNASDLLARLRLSNCYILSYSLLPQRSAVTVRRQDTPGTHREPVAVPSVQQQQIRYYMEI